LRRFNRDTLCVNQIKTLSIARRSGAPKIKR
jgi:hypothetical protein